MKKKRHITAFYMEMLVLIAVFTVTILILTKVFALAGEQSAKAQVLTNSVCLAENAAELFMASHGEEDLLAMLERNGNVDVTQESGHKNFRTRYDNNMNPSAEGDYLVEIEWVPETSPGGTFVRGIITVYWNGQQEPVYSLETGLFLR